MEEMGIGIVGLGVVGCAVQEYFKDHGANVAAYDKFKDIGSFDGLNEADIIYVCVPTPYRQGWGLDVSAVEETIEGLQGNKIVVIKSTVPPGTTSGLQERFPQHRLFFNPEFLREKSAVDDFLHPDRQIVGHCEEPGLAQRLLDTLPEAPFSAIMPAASAELIKLATNSYLALKVVFANQIYDLSAALNLDYAEVKAGVAADPRIGSSHLDVFDGSCRGYGGKCLPKDTAGFIDFAEMTGIPPRSAQSSAAHQPETEPRRQRAAQLRRLNSREREAPRHLLDEYSLAVHGGTLQRDCRRRQTRLRGVV